MGGNRGDQQQQQLTQPPASWLQQRWHSVAWSRGRARFGLWLLFPGQSSTVALELLLKAQIRACFFAKPSPTPFTSVILEVI